MRLFFCTLIFCTYFAFASSAQAAISADSVRDNSNNSIVTSVPMPTQTPGSSGVNSPNLYVATSGRTGNWNLHAQVVTSFTDGSITIPDGDIYAQGGSGEVSLSSWGLLHGAINADNSPSFYLRTKPGSSIPAGDYTGSIRFRASNITPAETDTIDLSVTIHVLGYLSFGSIYNVTADVVQGQNPGPVSAFNFPTQTANGGVWSDNFRITVSTNSRWYALIHVSETFAQLGDPSTIKPTNTFLLDAPAQTTAFGSVPLEIENNISGSQSGIFRLRSLASPGLEAGDYTGEFTVTVTVDD
jgi:hypothetical protein